MPLRVAILDFDGTLVDSVGLKDRAFEELFACYPQWEREILPYHLANNAVIRFEKFRHIVEDILCEEYTTEREAELSGRFSELVAEQIAEAPEVPGAAELLDALDAAGVRTYVVSMSPKDEFEGILEARGLTGRFADVYTHPWAKTDAIAAILERESVDPDEAVMVGDTPEDAVAAEACCVPFVGRDSGKPFGPGVLVFSDAHGVLDDLERRIGAIPG